MARGLGGGHVRRPGGGRHRRRRRARRDEGHVTPRTRDASQATAWRRAMRYASLLVLVVIMMASVPVKSPGDEHAGHHPGGAAPAPDVAAPGPAGTSPAEGMAGMTPAASSGACKGGDCGPGAPATPLYPSLMTLPALTPEKRAEIEALASQQINEGTARLAKGSESLTRATQAGDYAAMQQSVGLMRESLAELEAGIA